MTNEQLAVLLDSIADHLEAWLYTIDEKLGDSVKRSMEWWNGSNRVGPTVTVGVALDLGLNLEDDDSLKKIGFERRPTGRAVVLFDLYYAARSLRIHAENLREEQE
jgi:hypothetical protein